MLKTIQSYTFVIQSETAARGFLVGSRQHAPIRITIDGTQHGLGLSTLRAIARDLSRYERLPSVVLYEEGRTEGQLIYSWTQD